MTDKEKLQNELQKDSLEIERLMAIDKQIQSEQVDFDQMLILQREALGNISQTELTEISSLRAPPKDVVNTITGLRALLDSEGLIGEHADRPATGIKRAGNSPDKHTQSWDKVKKELLTNKKSLLLKLMDDFKIQNVPDEAVPHLVERGYKLNLINRNLGEELKSKNVAASKFGYYVEYSYKALEIIENQNRQQQIHN